MLKILKGSENYYFALYEEISKKGYLEQRTISYGLKYDVETKRFSLINGYYLNLKEIDMYELIFNEKNILEEIKKKIKRRIKFLNKKTNQILTQSDFLFILLEQEIEKYEKEILK